jgi:hypothetical protein
LFNPTVLVTACLRTVSIDIILCGAFSSTALHRTPCFGTALLDIADIADIAAA